jgi:hypothetical protein
MLRQLSCDPRWSFTDAQNARLFRDYVGVKTDDAFILTEYPTVQLFHHRIEKLLSSFSCNCPSSSLGPGACDACRPGDRRGSHGSKSHQRARVVLGNRQ